MKMDCGFEARNCGFNKMNEILFGIPTILVQERASERKVPFSYRECKAKMIDSKNPFKKLKTICLKSNFQERLISVS